MLIFAKLERPGVTRFVAAVACHINAGKCFFTVNFGFWFCFSGLTVVAAVSWTWTDSRLTSLTLLLRRTSRASEVQFWKI
jgi:hypothetical protein